MRYEDIADKVLMPMSQDEREYMTWLLEGPSEDYKLLVIRLAREGCEFPKQQAALMMRNTAGMARQLIAEMRPPYEHMLLPEETE